MTFYDQNNKVIVKCGNVGDDSKVKNITHDAKIIYVYGASSIDNKCVGMIGFTFYKPQQISIEDLEKDVGIEVKKNNTVKTTVVEKKKNVSPAPRKTETKVKRISVINKK